MLLFDIHHTGTIELREDTVETLLATACLLQLTAVVSACCSFLGKQLHASNCLGFALFAEQQSCGALLESACAFTHDKFMEVCEFYFSIYTKLYMFHKSCVVGVEESRVLSAEC